jgi:hypothetical protein
MPRWILRRLPIALALLAAAPASAGAPDWAALREVGTVFVATTDADGDPRETKVWLAVVDGAGYVRTGGTTWGENAARDGELVLRAGEASWPMRVELVEDDALRQRVTDAFREKYGFSDRMVSWVRGSRPKIMRLHPKE